MVRTTFDDEPHGSDCGEMFFDEVRVLGRTVMDWPHVTDGIHRICYTGRGSGFLAAVVRFRSHLADAPEWGPDTEVALLWTAEAYSFGVEHAYPCRYWYSLTAANMLWIITQLAEIERRFCCNLGL